MMAYIAQITYFFHFYKFESNVNYFKIRDNY